jgi:hypothetical protein
MSVARRRRSSDFQDIVGRLEGIFDILRGAAFSKK